MNYTEIRKGFTLIEIIVVIAVMGILTAAIVPAYQSFIQEAKLTQDVTVIRNALQIAQSKARAGDGGASATCASYTGYDVLISTRSISTIRCCESTCLGATSPTIASNSITTLQNTIVSPANGTRIRFVPLTGATTTATNIVIRNSSISKCKAIQINTSGISTIGNLYAC
jgi:prepilin-type N-terminal cleavage/methylation domain-containing protein